MSKVWIIFIQIHKKPFLFKITLNEFYWILSKWKKEIEWNWKIDGENESLKKSGMKDPFKGLNYLVSNYENAKAKRKHILFQYHKLVTQ